MYNLTSSSLQNRELEVCVHCKDNDAETLCGVLFLRLEDFLAYSNSSTLCLPLEPQGILLAEVAYEGPRTEKRKPNLKRGRKIFKGQKTEW